MLGKIEGKRRGGPTESRWTVSVAMDTAYL